MMPSVPVSFFQFRSALSWGSISSGCSAQTPPADALKVNLSGKSRGLRVMMSTDPATPPSTSEACALLWTTIWLTSSDGSRV